MPNWNMKFYIETIGCQQNEYDASRLSVFLKSFGLTETTAKEAEVVFILACSVRQTAVDRVFGRTRNWFKSGKKVYITACLITEDKKKLEKIGAVYFKDFDELKSILELEAVCSQFTTNSCPYIPIMTGCNNFCSYCIVPYTRGREKSRPTKEIIREAKKLISHFSTAQHRSEKLEIMLIGQNVNSYKFGFAKLLKKINDLPGDFEISFISSHPKDMKADVIEAIAVLPKVKKEVHLPLQSGSDKILKMMNRPYSAEEYLRLVKSLKSKVHQVRLTTDIIVGFPGETKADFQKTVELCKKVGFSLAYINKYSPRKGTAAFKLGDPVSWQEKQSRWKVLNSLINK